MQSKNLLQHIRTGHRINRLTFYLLVTVLILGSVAMLYRAEAWTSSAQTLPTGDGEVFFGTVFVDSTGRVHVAWMDTDGAVKTGAIRYTRGILNSKKTGITWEQTQQPGSTSIHRNNPPGLVVTRNGTVFIGYGGTDNKYHVLVNTQRGARGAWQDEVAASMQGDGNATNFAVSLHTAADGRAFLSWGSGLGNGAARLLLTYRQGAKSWAPVQQVSRTSMYLISYVRLVTSGSGSGTTVHILYQHLRRDGERPRTGYTRWRMNRTFDSIDFSELLGFNEGTDPAIAVDQTTGRLFGSFVSRVSGADSQYTMRLTQSANNGTTWASPSSVRIQKNIWPGPAWFDAVNNVLHMAVEQRFWDGRNRIPHIYHQSFNAGSNTYSAFTQVSGSEKNYQPQISLGPGLRVIVFSSEFARAIRYNFERSNDVPAVTMTRTPTRTPARTPTPAYTPTPSHTPTPQPERPAATIVIRGDLGVGRTKVQNVSIEFTNAVGEPDQYQLRNDTDPFAPPYNSLPENKIVEPWVLANPLSKGCETRTVRGLLYNARYNLTSEELRSNVQYDPGVSVDVLIQNPSLASTLTSVQDYGGGDGASDGHPGYTRSAFYYGRVTAHPDECSNLGSVRFGSSPATRLDPTFADGTFPFSELELEDGPQAVAVQVTDGAGHTETVTREIVLDRSKPQLMNAISSTLIAIDKNGNPLTTANSILITLHFSDTQVTDATYGEREPLPFWGVWLANSTQRYIVTDTAQLEELNALDWRPVEVQNATVATGSSSYSFSIRNWNLFTGLSNPPRGADYYVYARLLDGAGNFSPQTLATQRISVSPDATLPELYLPFLKR